jgi:hypothetical protein
VRRDYPRREANEAARRAWVRMKRDASRIRRAVFKALKAEFAGKRVEGVDKIKAVIHRVFEEETAD